MRCDVTEHGLTQGAVGSRVIFAQHVSQDSVGDQRTTPASLKRKRFTRELGANKIMKRPGGALPKLSPERRVLE